MFRNRPIQTNLLLQLCAAHCASLGSEDLTTYPAWTWQRVQFELNAEAMEILWL